jgi:polyisoprenyl-phosphate glycosyltransferase
MISVRNPETTIEYSLVIPVYENLSGLHLLAERITAVFQKQLNSPYEIIFVDDGSRSRQTWQTIADLAKNDTCIKAVRLMRNYGKSSAIMCGFSHSVGKWVITIDDDLQQSPEDIPKLIEHRDHDVVVATFIKKKHGFVARLGSTVKAGFDRHVLRLPFKMSPLKLIKRQVVAAVLTMPTPRPYIPGLLAHVTMDFYPVPLEHHHSFVGRSRYNNFTRVRQLSNQLISNSGFLLRLITLVGVGSLIFGILMCCHFLFSMIGSDNFPNGWSVAIAINLILGGVILLGLGFVGEYLIRLIELGSKKPAYIEAELILDGVSVSIEAEPISRFDVQRQNR